MPNLATRLPDLAPAEAADPDTERLRLFDAVTTLIRNASEQAPILLVLDDLESASDQTLALLSHLLERSKDSRLLAGAHAADSEAGTPLDSALGRFLALEGNARIDLKGLTASHVASLLERAEGITGTPDLAERIQRETEGSPRYIAELIDRLRAGDVLVVDQFEELFTLCRDQEERQRFINAPLHAVSVPGGRTMVVLAMRADFYGEAAGYPGFAEALDSGNALLGPMDEDALRAVIEEPARVAGLRVEPGLVDLMVNDVLGEPGGLPLLSHVLLETWQRRDGRSLTTAGYHGAGGVRGAIARTAQAEYEALTPDEQVIARNLFVRLAELGEGTEDTRRSASLDEMVPAGADAAVVSAVIQRLADARLLTTSEDTVEVVHEALIREWPRLRAWLDDDREGLRLMRHITQSAQAWEGLDHDDSELYRGSGLEAAVDWVERAAPELNPQEREFLNASRELHERELREATARLRRLVC